LTRIPLESAAGRRGSESLRRGFTLQNVSHFSRRPRVVDVAWRNPAPRTREKLCFPLFQAGTEMDGRPAFGIRDVPDMRTGLFFLSSSAHRPHAAPLSPRDSGHYGEVRAVGKGKRAGNQRIRPHSCFVRNLRSGAYSQGSSRPPARARAVHGLDHDGGKGRGQGRALDKAKRCKNVV